MDRINGGPPIPAETSDSSADVDVTVKRSDPISGGHPVPAETSDSSADDDLTVKKAQGINGGNSFPDKGECKGPSCNTGTRSAGDQVDDPAKGKSALEGVMLRPAAQDKISDNLNQGAQGINGGRSVPEQTLSSSTDVDTNEDKGETETGPKAGTLTSCQPEEDDNLDSEPPSACEKPKSNDDPILQCCVQCQKKYPESEVILLTDHKNRQNRAADMGLRSCSSKTLSALLTEITKGAISPCPESDIPANPNQSMAGKGPSPTQKNQKVARAKWSGMDRINGGPPIPAETSDSSADVDLTDKRAQGINGGHPIPEETPSSSTDVDTKKDKGALLINGGNFFPDKGVIIVPDTDVLIYSPHVQNQLDRLLKGLGSLYVPWVVQQELDALKGGNKHKSRKNRRAQKVVDHLHFYFRLKHPRVGGQTPFEWSGMDRIKGGHPVPAETSDSSADVDLTVKREVIIVPDTNMYSPRSVENLQKGLGRPCLIIPRVVRQELDAHKLDKEVRVQTPAEAEVFYFPLKSNDDHILQCCVQCQEKCPHSEVILVTGDKSLYNKAAVMRHYCYQGAVMRLHCYDSVAECIADWKC